jgi:hypothetical protein
MVAVSDCVTRPNRVGLGRGREINLALAILGGRPTAERRSWLEGRMHNSPPRIFQWAPWLMAATGAVLSAYVVLAYRFDQPLGGSDFDQLWQSARALLAGRDPYAAIGPSDPSRFQFPLYYPLTATLVAVPFAPLSFRLARLVFAAMAGGVLGYAFGQHRPWLWPTFFGVPFMLAARNVQLSPLLTAAILFPWLGWLAAAKPNLGLVMLAGSSSRQAVLILLSGSAALLLLSLALRPDWPWEWREALATGHHFRPLILRPGGVIMLMALLRWWDPDARLLLTLALVPQTGLFYDALPACLVARTRMQSAVIALCTQIVGVYATSLRAPDFVDASWKTGTLVLWGALVPPLVVVLRRGVRRTGPAS